MHKLLTILFLAIGVLTAQAEVKINNIWFSLDRKGKLATVVPAEDGTLQTSDWQDAGLVRV